MATIDLFTSPKRFRGLALRHQRNALRSWRASGAVGRIMVFGALEGDTGVLEETGAENVTGVREVKDGIPSIGSMFSLAAERSRADLLMFTNADMIYLADFFAGVGSCRNHLGDAFLMMGSRMDFDSEEDWSFDTAEGLDRFRRYLEGNGAMHPPAGSDYFIFPRKQYLENPLPDLWIGRGGWDLYMVHHAGEKGIRTVDLSRAVHGFHQNHDYSHRGDAGRPAYEEDPEAAFNLSLLPAGVPWGRLTLRGCECEWTGTEVVEKAKRKPGPRRPGTPPPREPSPGWIERGLRKVKRLLSGHWQAVPPAVQTPAAGDRREARRVEARKAVASSPDPLRIVVGAAKTSFDGWISTNLDVLDLLQAKDWEELFAGRPVDRVLAEHVWEHLSPENGVIGLRNAAAHLRSGGRIRIAVPDGHHPDPVYIDHVRPGGIGPGADDHKILYTVELMCEAMRAAGLVPIPLEHWDAAGVYHAEEWDAADGMVTRSARFDPRNRDGRLAYTSLIVDGVKP